MAQVTQEQINQALSLVQRVRGAVISVDALVSEYSSVSEDILDIIERLLRTAPVETAPVETAPVEKEPTQEQKKEYIKAHDLSTLGYRIVGIDRAVDAGVDWWYNKIRSIREYTGKQ